MLVPFDFRDVTSIYFSSSFAWTWNLGTFCVAWSDSLYIVCTVCIWLQRHCCIRANTLRVLARSFDFTIPKCGSWIFMRNWLQKSLGTTIWPSTAIIPSTICSVNLYRKYGLTSSGNSDWLSGQLFWITVASFISVSSRIVCCLIIAQSTLMSLWIPRSAICRSSVGSSLQVSLLTSTKCDKQLAIGTCVLHTWYSFHTDLISIVVTGVLVKCHLRLCWIHWPEVSGQYELWSSNWTNNGVSVLSQAPLLATHVLCYCITSELTSGLWKWKL